MKKTLLLIFLLLLLFIPLALYLISFKSPTQTFSTNKSDLVIYTPLPKNIYFPIIKEFQERYQIKIDIQEETEENILNLIKDSASQFNGDIVFGISSDTIANNEEYFSSSLSFASIPFVIIYNTNLITYHEKLDGYDSLTNPYFKGKIGFINPDTSMLYAKLIDFMACNYKDPEAFKSLFVENVKKPYYNLPDDINRAITNGEITVAITSEQSANLLSIQNKHIKYINPTNNTCFINFETALPAATSYNDLAILFLEFSISADVSRFISNYINAY